MTAMNKNNLELTVADSQLSGIAGLTSIPTSAGSSADSLFRCPWCDRSFKSKIGLGVHKRSAHPDEYFAETAVSQKKARWTEPESHRLAEAEAEIVRSGKTTNINQQLHTLFPTRTLESIKSKRKAAAYKKLVDDKLKIMTSLPPVPASPPAPAPPPVPAAPPVPVTQPTTVPNADEESPVAPEDVPPGADEDPWKLNEDTLIVGSAEYYLDDLNTNPALRPPPTSDEMNILDKAFGLIFTTPDSAKSLLVSYLTSVLSPANFGDKLERK